MTIPYAKVIVKGSPITKSNFKLHNSKGRAILPSNTGKAYDKYANYEEEISYEARIQNPNIVLEESLIAVLKVYYKSSKRHPDTSNITKSIFDGIEKSGIILNDVQIRKIIIEEFYDKECPRFELELFGESYYNFDYAINKNSEPREKILYNQKSKNNISQNKKDKTTKEDKLSNLNKDIKICDLCKKELKAGEFFTANKGTTTICRKCLTKTF